MLPPRKPVVKEIPPRISTTGGRVPFRRPTCFRSSQESNCAIVWSHPRQKRPAMKTTACLFAGLIVATLSFAAQAADDPTGTWTWKVERNGQSRDVTLKLKLE